MRGEKERVYQRGPTLFVNELVGTVRRTACTGKGDFFTVSSCLDGSFLLQNAS